MPFDNRFLKGFWWILGRILVPKSTPKSMLSSKGVFLKKPCFSLGKTYFFEIQWVEVGTKNQCGNRKARKLNFDRCLIDLGAILALQNGAKTLKNRC